MWPGIGDATFALPVTRPTGLSPVFLAAADTTGDGLADLQVADSESGEVCLFLGQTTTDGNVVAGPAGIYSAVRNEFFAVGDLDGDGRADIVAADDTGDTVRVLRNDGSLRFTPMATLHVPADNTNEPVLIDLDNDGDLDIIQLHTSGYSIFRNGGNFTFDLITSQNVNGGLLMGLALDLFKNGLPDLLASSYGAGTLSCYQNKQGALSLVMSLKSGAGTAGMAVGDYDLDGDLDLASVNFNESTLTITGRVGQHFAQEYKVFATEDQPTYVRAADVNRDGRPDLIVSHLTGPDILTYIAAHGPLDFEAPTSTITNGRPVAMVTPDVDLNGVPDVVYCQFETGRTSIRLIQEDAAYGPVVSTFPSQYAITSILYVTWTATVWRMSSRSPSHGASSNT